MPRLTHPPGMPAEVAEMFEVLGTNKARGQVLRVLAERGPLTTREVADALEVSGVSALRHLQDLEKAGLVEADRPAGSRLGSAGIRWASRPANVDEHLRRIRNWLLADDAPDPEA